MIDTDIKEYVESMTDNLEKLKHCFTDNVYNNEEIIITNIEYSTNVSFQNNKIKHGIGMIVYYKYSEDEENGITEERYLVI